LYNFIEDRFFGHPPKKELSKEGLKLVAVGTLRYQKNYPYLIEAFKKMPANVSLHIYGDGPYREQLQKDIEAFGLNITLKGSQKEIQNILPAYDAFVMSSFFEGQPLALLEAIACGLPALLSDIPVLREVTGENALYFDLADPEDLVRKVQAILNREVDITRFTGAGTGTHQHLCPKRNVSAKTKRPLPFGGRQREKTGGISDLWFLF
jgi:glycosyltransferase involved in cell wall biosynthesis